VRGADGRSVGLFLQDNFARACKRSGAWMSSLRWQNRNRNAGRRRGPQAGEPELPVILNNNNFAKGARRADAAVAGRRAHAVPRVRPRPARAAVERHLRAPVGHAGAARLRRAALADVRALDHRAEVLQRHARHWQTGEPIPHALVERLLAARRFNQGYETVRYTASAIVDMAVHALPDAEPPADLCAFEAEKLDAVGLPHGVGLNHRLVHFQHLFSARLRRGYYVYLWAEVLDADGYDAFTEAGDPFDPAVASACCAASTPAATAGAGRRLRRLPRPRADREPMLRKKGLLDTEAVTA
jgi:peptidyl-dipeptidase Dcp